MNTFTFIDFFSGIGGFRYAAEEHNGKCLGFSEIDSHCIKDYKNNFDTNNELNLGSITELDKLPKADIYFGGVPCQPWSVAGSKKGFDDPRGKLWEDVIRVTAINKPKVFIYENVKGLFDPRNKENLELLIKEFKKIGYNLSYRVLNSYDFGLCQNRERIFLVGVDRNKFKSKYFDFPNAKIQKSRLADIIDEFKDLKIKPKAKIQEKDLFGSVIPASRNRFQKNDELNDFFIFCDTRDGHTTIHSWDIIRTSKRDREICLAILKNRRKNIYGKFDGNPLTYNNIKALVPNLKIKELERLVSKEIIIKNENKFELEYTKNSAGIFGIYRVYMPKSDIFPTITATENRDFISLVDIDSDNKDDYKKRFIKEVYRQKKYRKLTGRECARLQGFPENMLLNKNDKIAKKQFGNAVPVNVVSAILEELIKQGFLLK